MDGRQPGLEADYAWFARNGQSSAVPRSATCCIPDRSVDIVPAAKLFTAQSTPCSVQMCGGASARAHCGSAQELARSGFQRVYPLKVRLIACV